MSKDQLDYLLSVTKPIIPHLKKPKPKDKASWRNSSSNFIHKNQQELSPGVETFSVGWLPQGHAYDPNATLAISRSIQDDTSGNIKTWITKMEPISDFSNILLSFTHPPLHEATMMSLEKYCQMPSIAPLATKWVSLFHGISVISNRITPPHIDRSGSWSWFDQLISFGSYDYAVLKLDELGEWDHGDRICFAYLVKKSIFDFLKVPLPIEFNFHIQLFYKSNLSASANYNNILINTLINMSASTKSSFYHLKKEEQEILQTIENHQKTLEEAQANKKSSKSLKIIKSSTMTIINKKKALKLVQNQLQKYQSHDNESAAVPTSSPIVSHTPSGPSATTSSTTKIPITPTLVIPLSLENPGTPDSSVSASRSSLTSRSFPASEDDSVPGISTIQDDGQSTSVYSTVSHSTKSSHQDEDGDEYEPYSGNEKYVEIDDDEVDDEMKLITPKTRKTLFKGIPKRGHDSSSSEEVILEKLKEKGKTKPIHPRKKARSEKHYTYEEGMEILRNWLKATPFDRPEIPTSLKNQVRKVPEYLSEAYTTTEKLTLEMLTNESGNSVCIHHELKDRVTAHVDGKESGGGIQIHGVPVPRMMKTKKRKDDQVPGYFSCGCAIDTAVAGAALWKSWHISSTIKNNLLRP
ncbi:hypothetical protein Agabi119p4_9711 [Agaricus bisporus var. burnettii]|uniref:Uncharacterized protein n=1 Tax=Agaricus bisporus var. burnettii TaxID=192524 RepID=A0A8H7C538_AGABI|nr:hypothetical protein Agabi119p4_9711 [Agaricus bisporus var. burnettii]